MKSIEQRRKEVIDLIRRNRDPKDYFFKSIPFENDDVPRYLEGLKKFLDRSEKSSIQIGCTA